MPHPVRVSSSPPTRPAPLRKMSGAPSHGDRVVKTPVHVRDQRQVGGGLATGDLIRHNAAG